MAGIRAGVAYVAVELANVSALQDQLTREVLKASRKAGKKMSDDLAKNTTGTPAATVVARTFAQTLQQSSIGQKTSAILNAVLANSGIQGAKTFATNLGTRLSGLGSTISTPFKKAFDYVSDSAVGGFVKNVSNKISGLATSTGKTVQSVVGSVGSAAASAIGSVKSSLSSAMSGVSSFASSVGALGKQLGLLSFQLTTIGFMASLAFTAPAVGVGVLATVIGVKLAGEIENATIALESRLGPAAAGFIKQLRAIAVASPVYNTSDIITYAQKFIFAGLSIEQTTRFLKSFSNIAMTSGMTGTTQMTLALEAMAQMLSKGKVSMEELRRQLGNSLPGALKIASDALGVTQEDLNKMVESGNLSATTLIDAITRFGETPKFMSAAQAGAKSLTAQWDLLKESVQTKLADIVLKHMDKIKKALKDVGPAVYEFVDFFAKALPKALEWLDKIIKQLKKIKDKYDELTPAQQKFIKVLGIIAVVGGPIVAVLGMVATAVAGIASVIGFLGGTGGIILGIVAGVVVLGLGLYKLWQYLKNLYAEGGKFKDRIDGIVKSFKDNVLPTLEKVWDMLKNKIQKAIDQLTETFTKNKDKWQDVITVLKGLAYAIGFIVITVVAIVLGVMNGVLNAIGPLLMAIASLISGVFKIIGGLIAFFKDLFTGKWSELAGDLRMIWDGLWDAIVGTIVNVLKAIWGLISGFVEGVVGFFKWLYEILVGHSIIPDMVNAIKAWFDKLVAIASAIWSAIGAIIRWFIDNIIMRLVGWIQDAVASIKEKWSQLKEIFSTVLHIVAAKIGEVIDKVREIPGKIMSALSGAAGWLYGVGRNIINGLLDGMGSIAGAVASKARAIADSIPDWMKKILGIASPSKVMRKLGEWTMKGYALGLGDISMIVAKANALATAFQSPLKRDFAYSATVDVASRATLNIEHYYAPRDDDPAAQAEALTWINRTRGY